MSRLPTPVAAVPRLAAMNIDPDEAARAYRERALAPLRGIASAPEIRHLEEQLSGACTVEIAAFDEFTGLLDGSGFGAGFDHVVFDTAPTGHTLRLLGLPAAWESFIDVNPGGASCLGPRANLERQRLRYEAAVRALADPALTTVVLVTRPERGALTEAARTAAELADLRMRNQRLVVNGVFTATDRDDAIALALERRGHAALAAMPDALARPSPLHRAAAALQRRRHRRGSRVSVRRRNRCRTPRRPRCPARNSTCRRSPPWWTTWRSPTADS